MRQTFDRKVPLAEQRIRVANAKQPGRKHQHRPSSRVTERRKATAKRRAKLLATLHRKFKDAVREFFKGERDTYPKKPKRDV